MCICFTLGFIAEHFLPFNPLADELFEYVWPFYGVGALRVNIKCLLKGYTYLNNQLSAAGLFKYVWPFSGHQALKG